MARNIYPPIMIAGGLGLAFSVALLVSTFGEPKEEASDTLAIVQARVFPTGFGPEVDMWRVRLVESGLYVHARTQDLGKYRPGDCVLVRQFHGDLMTRRDVIIDVSTGCK